MANRTAAYASSVHGTNPQYLIEKIIRTRIHESKYWKEHCTLLNSALVLEKAVDDLRYIGGVYGGNVKPTPFLCLVLKLLQIQPSKDIVYLYIDQPDFKYLRALGAFYLRMVGNPIEVYKKLEPLLRDYRKLRSIDRTHKFTMIHMDEFIDNLLREQRVFDIILPRLTKRFVLEENRDIEPYKSELEEQNLIPTQMIEEKVEETVKSSKNYGTTRDSHSYEFERNRGHDQERHRSRHHDHVHDRSHDDRRRQDQEPRYNRDQQRPAVSAKSISPDRTNSYKKSRFRREDIEHENSIRAKLGLKPLK